VHKYIFPFWNTGRSMMQVRFELQTSCPLRRDFTFVLSARQIETTLGRQLQNSYTQKVR